MKEHMVGPVLLVGEGDFSFTAALRQQLPSGTYITATSLLNDTMVCRKHLAAKENIAALRASGVEVLLAVDATKLTSHDILSSRIYSTIIFNFPHSGGKSNIKRNRSLIKQFFISAVGILAINGKIIMTLCKGQGGTPVDQPLRSWHDSWQVVAMAANADLVLSHVLPFEAELYQQYSCTGFRSQDKHFHTEGAVTHVFTVAPPIMVSEQVIPKLVPVGSNTYLASPYLQDKLNRNLLDLAGHPLHLTKALIEENLRNLIQIKALPSQTCHISEQVSDTMAEEYSDKCYLLQTYSVSALSDDVEKLGVAEVASPMPVVQTSLHKLRTSMLQHAPQLLSDVMTAEHDEPGTLFLWGGDVYNRCEIKRGLLPIHHEMLGIQIVDPEIFRQFIETTLNDIFQGFLEAKCYDLSNSDDEDEEIVIHPDIQRCIDDGKLNGMHMIVLEIPAEPELKRGSGSESDSSSESDDFLHPKEDPPPTKWAVGITGILNKPQPDMCQSDSANSALSKSSQSQDLQSSVTLTEPEEPSCAFILHLESIGSKIFGIENPRWFWSKDPRSLDPFKFNGMEKLAKVGPLLGIGKGAASSQPTQQVLSHFQQFSPFSLHAPAWNHDISFWEKTTARLREQEFYDIIRDLAGDNVQEVALLDSFCDKDAGRRSRCYRQVFQSCDQPLSYTKSHDLQKYIRLQVHDKLNVILR